jgi:hypothetical protein
MRSKAKMAFVFSAILWIIGVIVWPGCVTPTLPPTRSPIAARNKADFEFVKSSQPSREEVTIKLGEPDAYLSDLRVACYRVTTVKRREVFLVLFVIPVSIDKLPDQYDVALVEFDEHDHVKRSGLVTQLNRESFDQTARKWLASKDRN